MRTNRYINSYVALIVIAMLVIVSCEKKEDNLPIKISLDEDAISLVLGTSQTLICTTDPPVSPSEITWSSSNPEVVTVNGEGLVQTVGLGKAVINAKIGNSTAFCDVIVTEKLVPVEGVTLNKTFLSLRVGDVEQLVAEIKPEEATNRKKRWSSSNDKVVSVHEINGSLVALAYGEAVITVTTIDGDHMATCTVEVLPIIELYSPSEQNIKLHPTDGEKKVEFTWNNIEGIDQYILKIAITDQFGEKDIIYSEKSPENKLDISEYELNEAIKGITGNSVPLYWTVESGTSGVKVLPSVAKVNFIPDRREFLKLSESSASGLQLQKMTGEYQYSITATGQATVNTVALKQAVNPDSTVVSMMYKSNQDLASTSIRFFNAAGSVMGIYRKGIPQSSEWKEWRIFEAELPSGWGRAGDYLQLDFGNTSDYKIELNAIRMAGMTHQEEKETYNPEILNIEKFSGDLSVILQEKNYFKFIVTGPDSNARTTALTRNLPAGAILFSFEYKSDQTLANDLQVFLGPALSESRSIRSGKVPANPSNEWKEYVVDMREIRGNYPDWGKPGDLLRIDFGEELSIGMTMEIRNIHFKMKD